MSWQPIDGAPKDGTEFLAYDATAKKMDVAHMKNICTTKPLWVCWAVQSDGEYGAGNDEFGGFDGNITHWMPLPPPPSDKGGEE